MTKMTLVKSFLAAAVAGGIALSANAQVIFSDDFESFSSTADLNGPYTQIWDAPFQLDTTRGYSGGNSVTSGITTANNEARMYINLPGGPVGGTDANPLSVSFMINTDVDHWHTRDYIELRGYENGAYGDGDLEELIAMGFWSGGSADVLQGRVLSNSTDWANLTSDHVTRADVAASEDWTQLVFLVKTDTVEFYLNGNLDSTIGRTAGIELDSLVLGSGLTTATQVWFDDVRVEVIPEPSTYAAIFGGLALLGAFVYRRRMSVKK